MENIRVQMGKDKGTQVAKTLGLRPKVVQIVSATMAGRNMNIMWRKTGCVTYLTQIGRDNTAAMS